MCFKKNEERTPQAGEDLSMKIYVRDQTILKYDLKPEIFYLIQMYIKSGVLAKLRLLLKL